MWLTLYFYWTVLLQTVFFFIFMEQNRNFLLFQFLRACKQMFPDGIFLTLSPLYWTSPSSSGLLCPSWWPSSQKSSEFPFVTVFAEIATPNTSKQESIHEVFLPWCAPYFFLRVEVIGAGAGQSQMCQTLIILQRHFPNFFFHSNKVQCPKALWVFNFIRLPGSGLFSCWNHFQLMVWLSHEHNMQVVSTRAS